MPRNIRTRPAVKKTASSPEVLVMGPADPDDVTFQLYVDMMVEYGIYLDADTEDRFPAKLPRDLTRYKAIVIDQALPVAKEIEKHRDYAKIKDRLRPYRKPDEFSWNDQRNQWVWVHTLLMKYEVTPQHPVFLARNAARRDRDVILGQVKYCWDNQPVWVRYGNDVSFVWLDGMWRAAEVYRNADLKKKVVSAAHDILDLFEKDELPCSKGPNRRLHCTEFLLTLWNKTGRRDKRLRDMAMKHMPTLKQARERARLYRTGAPYVRAENMGTPWTWALLGEYHRQPAFFQAGVDYLKGGYETLFDHSKMLWAHYGRKGASRGPVWGRGQAWAVYGLVELLARMPRKHPDFALLCSWLDQTAEGMRRTQDPVTGLWRTVMGDPGTRIEVSGAGMMLRHLSRAWRHNLCHAEFIPEMMARAWNGLKAHTFKHRTCTFCWGTGEGYDSAFYATVPCGGSPSISFLGGGAYVKAFGPLVK
jgi:hypothetical protein